MKFVLMVEDEPELREANRDLIRFRLESRGMPVTIVEATSGEEALAILARKDHSFDLIISDLHMGDKRMTGFDFLCRIRSEGVSPAPFVLFSGSDPNDVDFTSLDRLDGHFVRKPDSRLLFGVATKLLA